MSGLEELRKEIRRFVDEREWDQFHAPKNLAINLMVEAAEIAEHFRWSAIEAEVEDVEVVGEEVADVFFTLVLLADRLGLDLLEVTRKKLEKVGKRYPVELARGKCLKYTKYAECDD